MKITHKKTIIELEGKYERHDLKNILRCMFILGNDCVRYQGVPELFKKMDLDARQMGKLAQFADSMGNQL